MKQPIKTEPNIYSVDLSVYNRPSFAEGYTNGKRWISRGIDNLFPIYLIDLYNQGNTHGAVVDGKISYGVGRGLFINPEKANMIEVAKAMQFLKRPNPFESWDALIKKTWTNFEIHNSYAFEILRNQFGKPIEVYNIDIDRIAEDKNDSSIYLYSLDWETRFSTPINRQTNFNPKILELPKYDPKVIHDRCILVHYEPRPGMKHYSLPPYINALEAIEEEIEIAQFHLNNVKNGFVGGTMVNFLNGNATDAEKDQIEKRFNAKFANGNGSKILYNFADGKDQAAEVLPLQPNTLDKQFELRAKAVPKNIIIGHRAVSGMLFGIKTEGQLGGRTEILESYELFKETYVKPRQDTVLGSVNKIFEIFGLSPIVEVKELKPLANILPLTESTIAQIVPKQVLLDYVTEMYGLTIPEAVQPVKLSENKPFYFDTVGESADNYEEIECHAVHFTDDLSPIFKYNELEFIKLAEEDEKTTGTTTGNIPKIEPKTPKISPLVIKYRYGLRPDAPALQSESRDFCQRMMSLNKLYTKQEIEGIKNDMDNFDIINNSSAWLYRGGWYRDPNKEVAVPFCRHIWNQVVVRQKGVGLSFGGEGSGPNEGDREGMDYDTGGEELPKNISTRGDLKDILEKSQLQYTIQQSHIYGSDYISIEGVSYRVADHPKKDFSTYEPGVNDFRSYDDLYKHVKNKHDLRDKSQLESNYKKQAKKYIKKQGERDYLAPNGSRYGSEEGALNSLWRTKVDLPNIKHPLPKEKNYFD